jgi:predicted phosphodiesterase
MVRERSAAGSKRRLEAPLRIAVVSDIHGNLLALEAVIKDLDRVEPDQVWCGGDLGWGGPWASECIARVRDANWTTIKGNTDVWITGDPQTIEKPEDRDELKRVAEAHGISREDAQWLVSLPMGHSGPGSLLLVHGTPDSPFSAPEPDAPAGEFKPYEGRAGIVICGHIHKAFVRRLSEGTIVCNTGSVGLPKDGPCACYLVVDLQGPEWTLIHRRVAFDRDAAIKAGRELGGPVGERFLFHLGAD